MSIELIEPIISNNMLEANDMVEAKMAEIRERKMYEMKRMFAAKMEEGLGGLTKQEIEDRRKAGYRKASEVLSDPRGKNEMSDARKKLDMIRAKKKVNEAVDVQPDPEGRVRGGESKKKSPGLSPKTWRSKLYKKGLHIIRDVEREKKNDPKSGSEKETKKSKESDYPDTPGGRNREKFDKFVAKNPPGSGVVRAAKRVADAPIWKDLQDIGTRNL